MRKENKVVTISGKEELRSNCKYIKGVYYIKNEDCFEVNGVWYSRNGGKIEFDYSTNKWYFKGQLPYFSIVGIDDNGEVILGRHSIASPYYFANNCYSTALDMYNCIDYRILEDAGWIRIEDCWFKSSDIPYKRKDIAKIKGNYTYNSDDDKYLFQSKIDLYNSFNREISKNLRRYTRFLGNLTFGVELETASGIVPDYILNQHGTMAVRDGSISGLEFVTVPMSKSKGVQSIKDLCHILSKDCTIDLNCSYHVHIGNLTNDRIFTTSIYKLFYKIQDDLYRMFPYYKTDHKNVKNKNYCQKLKKLSILDLKKFDKVSWKCYVDNSYEKIFSFLSEGLLPDKDYNKKRGVHPIKTKWDRKRSRYMGLNLQNLIFSNRRTVEFRIAPPTLNSTKAIMWLFICCAIIKYAEKNYFKVFSKSSISIEEVLNIYKDLNPLSKDAAFLSEYLFAYYNHMRDLFNKDLNNGDVISAWDIIKDKEFSFSYKNISIF